MFKLIIGFVLGYFVGKARGQGRDFIYIGSDKERYKKATTGILLRPKKEDRKDER